MIPYRANLLIILLACTAAACSVAPPGGGMTVPPAPQVDYVTPVTPEIEPAPETGPGQLLPRVVRQGGG